MNERKRRGGARLGLPYALLGALLLAMGGAAAVRANTPQDAVRLVEESTEELFQSIEAERAAIEADRSRAAALVDKIVSPHVDYERVSRWVLGKHWPKATEEQRARFVEEFRTLLVRSYANAVIDHTGTPIEYLPVHPQEGGTEVTVPTQVPGAEGALRIDYRLYKTDSGGWKLFDVLVGGTSLVVTHRATFSEEIGKSGIDGLIRTLAEKNAKHGET